MAATLVAWAAATGCASYRVDPSPRVDSHRTPYYRDFDGLICYVWLPKDADEVVRYYGRDLLAEQLLPLQIGLVLRKDSAKDFQVDPSSASLEYEDGRQFQRVDSKAVHKKMAYSQWRSLPAWLLVLPGFFSSASISGANRKMLRSYGESEFDQQVPLNRGTAVAEDGYSRTLFFAGGEPIDLGQLRQGGRFKITVTPKQGTSLEPPETLNVIFR